MVFLEENKAYLKLKEYKKEIDVLLEDFLNKEVEFASQFGKITEDLCLGIKEFNLRGGKRIRPALVIEGYKCLKGDNLDEVKKASLSIELAEAYLLIHDDVIDNDDFRRGKPSFHKVFESKMAGKPFASKYGESMAIVGGDICALFCTDAILNTNFPLDIKLKTVSLYNKIIRVVGYGQQLDIHYGYSQDATEKNILNVFRMKTAAYTIEGPLQLGVSLAGGTEEQISKMSEYGVPVGQAFQIQDDILGMFGDEKKLGKPADSDLKEGKRTLLILKALEQADENQKKMLLGALGNPNITDDIVEEVRDIIKETGSLEYSKKLAVDLANKGKQAIIDSDFREEGKDFLIGIADYLINRDF